MMDHHEQRDQGSMPTNEMWSKGENSKKYEAKPSSSTKQKMQACPCHNDTLNEATNSCRWRHYVPRPKQWKLRHDGSGLEAVHSSWGCCQQGGLQTGPRQQLLLLPLLHCLQLLLLHCLRLLLFHCLQLLLLHSMLQCLVLLWQRRQLPGAHMCDTCTRVEDKLSPLIPAVFVVAAILYHCNQFMLIPSEKHSIDRVCSVSVKVCGTVSAEHPTSTQREGMLQLATSRSARVDSQSFQRQSHLTVQHRLFTHDKNNTDNNKTNNDNNYH